MRVIPPVVAAAPLPVTRAVPAVVAVVAAAAASAPPFTVAAAARAAGVSVMGGATAELLLPHALLDLASLAPVAVVFAADPAGQRTAHRA